MVKKISVAEYLLMSRKAPRNPRNKFSNKISTVDGMRFDSNLERDRWFKLKQMEKVGLIRNLKRQKEFTLEVNGFLICKYRADHCYDLLVSEGNFEPIVEDVKGHRTADYRLKKKLMKACYNIDIFEFPPKERKKRKKRNDA